MNHETTTFFERLIARTDPNYRNLVSGIADTYGRSGSLSVKQREIIERNAKIKQIPLPSELRSAADDDDDYEPIMAAFAPAKVTQHSIQADLCAAIASAFEQAAHRLRSLDDETPFD